MKALLPFAQWLSTTFLSTWIKTHESWVIPSIQIVHIVSIGIVMSSVFLVAFRVLGWAAMDQTLRQVNRRFFPWMTVALWTLLATGILMIIGEPARELVSFSFWAKMTLLAVGVVTAITFSRTVRAHEAAWDEVFAARPAVRVGAALTMIVWLGVVLMGRLIAYDHVWGALSPAAQY